MSGTEIDEPEGSMVPVAECLEDLIVLSSEFCGVWILAEGRAHEDDESFDVHAIGDFDESGHLFIGRASWDAVEVTVQIPDHGFLGVAGVGEWITWQFTTSVGGGPVVSCRFEIPIVGEWVKSLRCGVSYLLRVC